MKWNSEVYKCTILTLIAVLLAGILWRMPRKPLTVQDMQHAAVKGQQKAIRDKLPLSVIWDGTVTVDEVENTVPVEVQGTASVEIEH